MCNYKLSQNKYFQIKNKKNHLESSQNKAPNFVFSNSKENWCNLYPKINWKCMYI